MLSVFLMLSEILYRDEDTEILHRVNAGDKEAFGELVKKYERLVYNTSYQLIQNSEDAFDISQETFIKIYRSIKSFRGDSKVSTWIYKICQNTARDYIRSRSRRPAVSLTVFEDDEKNNSGDTQIDIADDSVSSKPDEMLEKKENIKAVREAIAQLSEDHRTIIVLRDIEGYAYEDIAEMLGLELGTVKSRLNRARLSIKDYLKKQNLF